MIDAANELGDLSHLGLAEAKKRIELIPDPVLKQALHFNLKDDGTWSVNIKAVHRNKKYIFGYLDYGPYTGPTLFINGAKSYQRKIQSDL